MQRTIIVLLLMLGITVATSAAATSGANWYVRKGATGSNNGTDWLNAWNELNQINFSSVACGDTIWLAGGTYTTSLNINKSCSSGAVLQIRRVLASDSIPASAAGWNASYDSQIVSNATVVIAGGGYITVDGRVGDAGTGTAYGMQINISSIGTYGIDRTSNAATNYITFTHIEMIGPTCVASGTCSGNTWGTHSNGVQANYWQYDHVWFHRFAEILRPWQDDHLLIQYSYLGENNDTPADHADLMYGGAPITNMTWRYNKLYSNTSQTIWCDTPGNCVNMYFYDNIVYSTTGSQIGWPRCTTACGPVYIYNNIFENVDGNPGDAWLKADSGSVLASGSDFANNIFYDVDPNSSGIINSSYYEYNAISSDENQACGSSANCFSFAKGNPICSFSGWTNMCPSTLTQADFHLTSTGKSLFGSKGKNLGSGPTASFSIGSPNQSYNIDMDGNSRSATGAWTVGPYESSAQAPPAPPTGPMASVR